MEQPPKEWDGPTHRAEDEEKLVHPRRQKLTPSEFSARGEAEALRIKKIRDELDVADKTDKAQAMMDSEQEKLGRELGSSREGLPLERTTEGEFIPRFSPEKIREMNLMLALRPSLLDDAALRAVLIDRLEAVANQMPIDNSVTGRISRAFLDEYLEKNPEKRFLLEQPTRLVATGLGYDLVHIDTVSQGKRELKEKVKNGKARGWFSGFFSSETKLIRKVQETALLLEELNQEYARLKKQMDEERLRLEAEKKAAELEKVRLVAEGERERSALIDKAMQDTTELRTKLVEEQNKAREGVKNERVEMLADVRHELVQLEKRRQNLEEDISFKELELQKLRRELDGLHALSAKVKQEQPLAAELLQKLNAEEKDREARNLREVLRRDLEKLRDCERGTRSDYRGYFSPKNFHETAEWCRQFARLAECAPLENLRVFAEQNKSESQYLEINHDRFQNVHLYPDYKKLWGDVFHEDFSSVENFKLHKTVFFLCFLPEY